MRSWLIALSLLLFACGSDQTTLPGEPLKLNGTLPAAIIGQSYTANVIAEGGIRPYSFFLDGKLPQGVNFNQGRFSGVPREKGSFSLTLTVEDANLSSRLLRLTLTVSDPPPPVLRLTQPQSETDQAFILAARLETAEAKGFQAQIILGPNLRPNLESLSAHKDLSWVLRYDEQRNILNLDGAFVRPLKDIEAFRLTLIPARSSRPAVQIRANFWDKDAKALATLRLDRILTDAKYHFTELLTVASNLGKEAPKAPEGETQVFLPGDLNQDRLVDAKDLELLRADYSWKPNAATPSTPAQTRPTTPVTPQPTQTAPQQPSPQTPEPEDPEDPEDPNPAEDGND